MTLKPKGCFVPTYKSVVGCGVAREEATVFQAEQLLAKFHRVPLTFSVGTHFAQEMQHMLMLPEIHQLHCVLDFKLIFGCCMLKNLSLLPIFFITLIFIYMNPSGVATHSFRSWGLQKRVTDPVISNTHSSCGSVKSINNICYRLSAMGRKWKTNMDTRE